MTDAIIQCNCGAKVRLPANRENRAFRCPSCRNGIALTTEARVLTSTRLSPGQAGATCPICQTGMSGEDDCVQCPSCDQMHHQECWSEIGGCGTYGCAEAPSIEKSEDSVQQPLTAWGDTKTCPACGEEIKSIALKCRFCKTEFSTVDPMSKRDLQRQARRDEHTEKLEKNLVTIFVISIIGCLAPVALIASLCVVLPNREKMRKCAPLHQLMGWAAIVLSVVFSLIWVGFILNEL